MDDVLQSSQQYRRTAWTWAAFAGVATAISWLLAIIDVLPGGFALFPPVFTLILGYYGMAALTAQIGTTTVTETDLVSKGVVRRHRCRWDDVSAIDIGSERSKTAFIDYVRVTTRNGQRFGLAAPRDIESTPEFDGGVAKIRAAWKSASAQDEVTVSDGQAEGHAG